MQCLFNILPNIRASCWEFSEMVTTQKAPIIKKYHSKDLNIAYNDGIGQGKAQAISEFKEKLKNGVDKWDYNRNAFLDLIDELAQKYLISQQEIEPKGNIKPSSDTISKAEHLKSYIENLMYFFEISKDQAMEIAEDVWNIPKEQRKSVLDEGRSRGFKEKEIK